MPQVPARTEKNIKLNSKLGRVSGAAPFFTQIYTNIVIFDHIFKTLIIVKVIMTLIT